MTSVGDFYLCGTALKYGRRSKWECGTERVATLVLHELASKVESAALSSLPKTEKERRKVNKIMARVERAMRRRMRKQNVRQICIGRDETTGKDLFYPPTVRTFSGGGGGSCSHRAWQARQCGFSSVGCIGDSSEYREKMASYLEAIS